MVIIQFDVAITSKERRGRLEDAYAASAGLAQPTSLRAYLRKQEQAARVNIQNGSLKMAATGGFAGHRAEFASYGPGEITQAEVVELWRDLVDDFDDAFLFLSNCCTNALDAFTVEFTLAPSSVTPVQNGVIIDSTGRWQQLCLQFTIAQNLIIGQPVNDKAVFLWMMFHEVPALESHGDYGQMRIAEGAQFT